MASDHIKLITKKLRKEVMTRSRLRNKYNKNRTYENWSNYEKQSNIHCGKSVRIRSYPGPYFPALNTERYGVPLSVFSPNA